MFTKDPILIYSFGILAVLLLRSPVAGEETNEEEYTGKLAEFGQFPYAIRLYSRLKDRSVNYCTAVIISRNKLLTAGHCCHTKATRYAVAGDPDQTDFVYMADRNKYFVYQVSKVILHPSFEKTTDKLVHDLCLLILEKHMSFRDGRETIEISYDKFQGKKNCTALGWGSNIGHQIQHKLYYKKAIGYSCLLSFGHSPKYAFVCLEPHAVCPGDSGGPLVCDGKLYGIASFFIGHGNESNPRCEEGVVDYYSVLYSEKDFIEKNSCVSTTYQIYIIYYSLAAWFLYSNLIFRLLFNIHIY